MELTKYERETVVTFNEEEDNATIYTASKIAMTKLDKIYKAYNTDECGKYYSVPKVCISFRSGKRKTKPTDEKKVLTDEQKKAMQNGRKKKIN